jgi:hypothetical protein
MFFDSAFRGELLSESWETRWEYLLHSYVGG